MAPRSRGYIPNDLDGQVIFSFALEAGTDDSEIREDLHMYVENWLKQFKQEYHQYGLRANDPCGSDELSFPLDIEILHVGAGFSECSKRDRTEAHTITVTCEPQGLHQRLYRYEAVLNKEFAERQNAGK